MVEVGLVISKIVIASALAYAIFVAIFCPCSRLLSCHLAFFYVPIAIAVVVAVCFNGLACW